MKTSKQIAVTSANIIVKICFKVVQTLVVARTTVACDWGSFKMKNQMFKDKATTTVPIMTHIFQA